MRAAQDLRVGANAVRTERGKFARYRWPAACSCTRMDALILTMFVSLVLAAGGVRSPDDVQALAAAGAEAAIVGRALLA